MFWIFLTSASSSWIFAFAGSEGRPLEWERYFACLLLSVKFICVSNVFRIDKFCFLMCKWSMTCPMEGNEIAAVNDNRVQSLPQILEQGNIWGWWIIFINRVLTLSRNWFWSHNNFFILEVVGFSHRCPYCLTLEWVLLIITFLLI